MTALEILKAIHDEHHEEDRDKKFDNAEDYLQFLFSHGDPDGYFTEVIANEHDRDKNIIYLTGRLRYDDDYILEVDFTSDVHGDYNISSMEVLKEPKFPPQYIKLTEINASLDFLHKYQVYSTDTGAMFIVTGGTSKKLQIKVFKGEIEDEGTITYQPNYNPEINKFNAWEQFIDGEEKDLKPEFKYKWI